MKTLNNEKMQAMQKILSAARSGTGKSFFVTGEAGTGKSLLMHHLQQELANVGIKFVTLAPTGIAAVNVGGQTVHSFFKFPMDVSYGLGRGMGSKKKGDPLFEMLEVCIIDEVSMLRSDLCEAVDGFLSSARDSFKPFGGVTMVFVGDLYQLPPVVVNEEKAKFSGDKYESPYFFSAKGIGKLRDTSKFSQIGLTEVFRQQDFQYKERLNKIRKGKQTKADLKWIDDNSASYDSMMKTDLLSTVYVATRNKVVDEMNKQCFDSIPGKVEKHFAKIEGDVPRKLYPVPRCVELKIGAQVMTLVNTPEYVNGSIGEIINIDFPNVTVRFNDGSVSVVKRHKYKIFEYDSDGAHIQKKQVGAYTQIPLTLAWAVTVHKSQGKSFDKMIVDLGYGCFAPGQAYVAISRARDLGKLFFKRPLAMKDIIVSKEIEEFLLLSRKE